MHWKIELIGITWDDGKGDYDVSQLPTRVLVDVHAATEGEAIEHAMSDVSDSYGMLIEGVKTTKVELLPRGRRDDF